MPVPLSFLVKNARSPVTSKAELVL